MSNRFVYSTEEATASQKLIFAHSSNQYCTVGHDSFALWVSFYNMFQANNEFKFLPVYFDKKEKMKVIQTYQSLSILSVVWGELLEISAYINKWNVSSVIQNHHQHRDYVSNPKTCLETPFKENWAQF